MKGRPHTFRCAGCKAKSNAAGTGNLGTEWETRYTRRRVPYQTWRWREGFGMNVEPIGTLIPKYGGDPVPGWWDHKVGYRCLDCGHEGTTSHPSIISRAYEKLRIAAITRVASKP